jgi:hypothetical protein
MQGDKALLISLAVVKPFEENYNKHPQPQIELLKKSLARYGAYKPVVVWRNPEDSEYRCLAGHGVIEAAMQLGWSEIWANDRSDLSHTEARALVAADNEIARRAEPDMDDLSQLIAAVNAEDESLAALAAGGEDELRRLLELAGEEPRGEEDEDDTGRLAEADELQQKWEVAEGQTWQLGRHILVCADSLDKETVRRLIGDRKVCVLTDPLYGISVIGGGGPTRFGKIGGENWVPANVYAAVIGDEDIESAKKSYELLTSLGVTDFIIFGGNYFTGFLPASRCWLVWDKREGIEGNTFADCELIWTSFDCPARLYPWRWMGLLRKGTRQEERVRRIHPTQKPVGLIKLIMQDFPFETYFDGFCGSGSVLLAAESNGKSCLAMELAPSYIAVTIQRWVDLTGGKPILAD